MDNGKECLTSSSKHIHMQMGTMSDLHTEHSVLVGVTRI